jgi:hypothetical protein
VVLKFTKAYMLIANSTSDAEKAMYAAFFSLKNQVIIPATNGNKINKAVIIVL